jgi:hypothetical protein
MNGVKNLGIQNDMQGSFNTYYKKNIWHIFYFTIWPEQTNRTPDVSAEGAELTYLAAYT